MKKLLMILALFIHFSGLAQQPVSDSIEMEEFNNSATLNQAKEYKQLNDSISLVKQFFSNGNLFQEVEMKNRMTMDTSYTEDYNTGQMKMVVCSAEGYVYHGIFKSYGPNGNLQVSGQYKNGRPIGEWLNSYSYETTVTLYDDKGNLLKTKGFYDKEQTQLHYEGKYCLIDSKAYNYLNLKGEAPFNIVKQNVPCGVWQYFDREGELIKKIRYEYVDWK